MPSRRWEEKSEVFYFLESVRKETRPLPLLIPSIVQGGKKGGLLWSVKGKKERPLSPARREKMTVLSEKGSQLPTSRIKGEERNELACLYLLY